MKALIVQGKSEFCHELADLLRKTGLTVDRARTWRESLAKAAQVDFDLVFLDMSFPDMPAGQADDLIPRLKEALTGARFVVMTADNSRELERRVRKHGILYYMTEPVDLNALAQLLHHQIKRAQINGWRTRAATR